ncbi:MAG: rRNA maturation RNase YbeY [Chlamydiales bacterium]|nr:rRNA maturation RNase YbeY [Chlamydiales bacterium]
MPLNVQVFNQQSSLAISSTSVQKVVSCLLLEFCNKKYDEVNIYFVGEEEICKLHEEFFDDPSPTDCISFPMDTEDDESEYLILGDIFISPKAALDYVSLDSKDVYEELTLYLVHGLLHLLGYDDINEADIKKMRAAEKIHLDHLKAHSVYLTAK